VTEERILNPQRAAPASAVRPTRAEVSLSRLRQNYHWLHAVAQVPVWGVVKADAYGHGAKAVGRTLERAGCQGLCVALVEEGVELRQAGITIPILVMSGNVEGAWVGLLEHKLTPVVSQIGQLRQLVEAARNRGSVPVAAHLKLDTGMGRLGATPGEVEALARTWAAQDLVRLDGLMTHLASADTDPGSVQEQLACFAAGERVLAGFGLRPRIRHAANTAGLLFHPATHFDFVRPGIGLYGLGPGPGLAAGAATNAGTELQPVLRVRSEIVALRMLPAGARVGYGGSWVAPRSSRIATVPIGYADGLFRNLSNRGEVLVRGRRAPIVGAVSMDLCSIDVTGIDGCELSDEVVVLGSQKGPLGQDTLGAEEIARHVGTIAWEVLTAVSRRVPRFYRED
jgi:alanine racemase